MTSLLPARSCVSHASPMPSPSASACKTLDTVGSCRTDRNLVLVGVAHGNGVQPHFADRPGGAVGGLRRETP
jgi:hypothetical protein